MKKKLVWFSDSPLLPTGYATISTQVCKRLVEKHGWEVVYAAHNYFGKVLEPGDIKGVPFKLYGKRRMDFLQDGLVPIIRSENPTVFVTLLDTFMVFPWFLDQDFAPARTVFYFPSDGGGGIPQHCDNILKRVTLPIAMSKYGQKQAKEVHGINTAYIPHAVDANHYKRFDDRQRGMLRQQWGLTGKFVVGVVARNQGRKHLDGTVKAFADFCKDKPDAVLLMHSDPTDPAAPYDLPALIQRYGITNRVVWTDTNWYAGWPYEKMPEVYNLMDVFLLTTSGEGWGVPTTEAMASEVPVIATDYTTTQEIVKDHEAGLGIKVAGEITGNWLVERAVISIEDAVQCLNKLYADANLRRTMGVNGRKAVLAEYDWDDVARQWDEVLTSLVRW